MRCSRGFAQRAGRDREARAVSGCIQECVRRFYDELAAANRHMSDYSVQPANRR